MLRPFPKRLMHDVLEYINEIRADRSVGSDWNAKMCHKTSIAKSLLVWPIVSAAQVDGNDEAPDIVRSDGASI
jgi:hypothetical protein